MLLKLSVRNYAIISEVDVVFSENLNIITGETGAGKSILVGALGLVLGDRADTSVLRDTGKKAVVEVTFSNAGGSSVRQMLEGWDIDASEELIIRRELAANGKSRAFINDTPVNLSQLHEIAAILVDMHLQFDTLDLGRNDFQRAVLDAVCDHESLLQEYRAAYGGYVRLQRQYDSLKASVESGGKELDYHRFLFDELSDLQWQEQEMEDLEAELRMLSHAEQIKTTLSKVSFQMSESEHPVVQQLKTMINQLQSLGANHPGLPAIADRMQSAYIELQDLSDELGSLNEKMHMDAGRMEEVSQRMATGQRLMKKHGVKTSAELLAIQADLERKLGLVTHAGEELGEIGKALDAAFAKSGKLAGKLSADRKRQAGILADKAVSLLQRVGMPNAALQVDLQPSPLYEGGLEQVHFLFDANRSNRFEPLHKVASGGELSRLMLVIKSLVARSVAMPTLIFDEIDSGISGEAARQVGILMRELAENHQVISITHQPQIAARAYTHFYVYKKETEGVVHTSIRSLSDGERVDAVAMMLGGENPSAVVLQNAKEMIDEGGGKKTTR